MEALYEDCKFLSEKESALAAATYASLAQKFLTGGPERQERSLLEIGCGNGAFLDAMLRLGIKHVVGCEPTRDALSFASAEVRPSIINDHFKPGHFKPETFDMVCAFHVLDHLSDPDEFVRESRRILKRGGRVLFICHDVDAMVNRVFRESSPVFDIEHIFLFNKSTLAALTENSGFDVISVGDLRNTYTVAYWLKYAPFLKKFVRFLPTVIKDRRLTLAAGNIFVCATKK
jgi:SAM-dependent methyltransferase